MFRFTVDFIDEGYPSTERGILTQTSYGDAANRLVEYYGKENVISISLYETEEVLIDEEILEMINEDKKQS